jgi:hypothetical protein
LQSQAQSLGEGFHYVFALFIEIESQALGGFIHSGWVIERDPCALGVTPCIEREHSGAP